MDATDFAIGIVLIAALAWISIIALGQSVANVSIADLYVISELNKPLISLSDVCPAQSGFELVQPKRIEMEPYYILAGKTDFNQTYFCFYRKLEQESA